ncbi:MAG: response regulator [Terriglobales bacterium]
MPSTQTPIQVLSVEHNNESRLALRSFFAGYTDLALAAETADLAETLEKLQSQRIDVVLVDLSLPGLDGIELIKRIRQSRPDARVVIFTASDTAEDIFAAMDAGADGYVLKGNYSRVLEMAIRSVRLSAVWLDPGIARQLLQAIQTATTASPTSRILPTGLVSIPLLPEEKSLLTEVAASNCVDGVCMVDPSFVRKLRRFSGH